MKHPLTKNSPRSTPFPRRLGRWLERHGALPSYGGGILLGLAVCFFGAATNSMAGWLYVISGMSLALLIVAALLPRRSLRGITVERRPIVPVSAGEALLIEVVIRNTDPKGFVTLVQGRDGLPPTLGPAPTQAFEVIPPQGVYEWQYTQPTHRRGIYHWQRLELRTGAPLGLFWCRRSWLAPAQAIVYPQVLPLARCPLVDTVGTEDSTQNQSDRRYQAATEGLTKALRNYRYGDPTRLIHWRSSARFDEFKVRELEIITSGQELVIALDSGDRWGEETFEQAVITAASLYFYAVRAQLSVRLWTPGGGLVTGARAVLMTLAGVEREEKPRHDRPDRVPLIWITANPDSLIPLSGEHRWIYLAPDEHQSLPLSLPCRGLVLYPDRDLARQLQQPF